MQTKKCSKCLKVKSVKEFCARSARAGRKAGLQSYCKGCNNENKNAGRKSIPDAGREKFLKTKYDITIEEYEELLLLQEGVCAICKLTCSSGKRLAVDHNHVTGKVRGLLCFNCNSALGKLKADLGPETVYAAAEYVKLYSD